MRLLQLSDIHFVESAKDDERYAPVEDCFLQDIGDQNDETKINYVLICGDLAFSGKKEEYERAAQFIQRICDKVGCSKNEVLVVPGNHDLDRKTSSTLKSYIGGTISSNPDAFINACKDSSELMSILKALYEPFRNYYEFAKEYGCVSDFEKIIFGQDVIEISDNKTMTSWTKLLTENGESIVRVVGTNTALLSGTQNKIVKEVLPSLMWSSYRKDGKTLNILMGHHPMDDIANQKDISRQIDCRFQLQLSGHRHVQTSSKNVVALKITSAAFEPELPRRKKEQDIYYPVYNLIDIRPEAGHFFTIKVSPVVWDWDESGFIENDTIDFIASAGYKTSVQGRKAKSMPSKSTTPSKTQNDAALSVNTVEIMLKSMDYEHRRQTVNRTFPDAVLSGATGNLSVVMKKALDEDKVSTLSAITGVNYLRYLTQILKDKK